MSFGHGPHHCLGDELARIELRILFGTMLRHFPDLRLTVPAEQIRTHRHRVVYEVAENSP